MFALKNLKINSNAHLEIGGCDTTELAKEYGATDIINYKNGDVVESGNHKELIKKGGFYAKLSNSQFASS